MNENDSKNTQAASSTMADTGFSWGSSQYDSAAEQYVDLCKQEAEHGRDKVLAKYGIKVGQVQTFEGEALKSFKDSRFKDFAEWEADGEDVACERVQLEDVNDVTGALNSLADQAWDLWSGAPYIAAIVFPELNLDSIPDAPGLGPVISALVQSDNYRVGTICWLLKSYGFVEDDEPFKEWDT